MRRAMMPSTERDYEFIADLATKGARLGKSEVVGIRRLAATQQTRLLRNVAQVRPVAIAPRRRDREGALVNALDLRRVGYLTRVGAFGVGIYLEPSNLSHRKFIVRRCRRLECWELR